MQEVKTLKKVTKLRTFFDFSFEEIGAEGNEAVYAEPVNVFFKKIVGNKARI